MSCGFFITFTLFVMSNSGYNTRKHSSLMDTPENAYKTSNAPLRFVEPDVIADAFLHCDTRKVDKSGCISFGKRLYEVGLPLIGQTVDVVFDPADMETLTVEHKSTGYTSRVKELVIGPYSGKRPKLPVTCLPEPTATSRLLDAKDESYSRNQETVRRAIRYTAFEEGEPNV